MTVHRRVGDAQGALEADVAAGMAATPEELPPERFCDEEGSGLVGPITALPEYCSDRREREVLVGAGEEHDLPPLIRVGEIRARRGPGAALESRFAVPAAASGLDGAATASSAFTAGLPGRWGTSRDRCGSSPSPRSPSGPWPTA